MSLFYQELNWTIEDHVCAILDAARDIAMGSKLHKRRKIAPYYRIAAGMLPEHFNNLYHYLTLMLPPSRLEWLSELYAEYHNGLKASVITTVNKESRDYDSILGGRKTSLTIDQQNEMKNILDIEVLGEVSLMKAMALRGHTLTKHQCRGFIRLYKK